MALKAGSVLSLPDLACMGTISKVGKVYLSEKGVYHVIPLEIKGKFAGRDGVFFLVFEPRWFGASFDPDDLKEELSNGRPVKYGMYCRTINGEARPSILVSVLGDDFDAFGALFEGNDDPTAEDVEEALRQYLVGRDVIYVMQQRKDEDGKPMEQYNIQGFRPATSESIDNLIEQAASTKRKVPLVVTWDTE